MTRKRLLTPACFYALAKVALSLVCSAEAAPVAPVFTNDTTVNSLSFNDTFGHTVTIGTYNPSTGFWMPAGTQAIAIGVSPVTGTCTNGQVLYNNAGMVGCVTAGSGTVTSVALTVPAWLTISGSPITGAGTLAVTGTSEPANEVLASPNGAPGAMTPRTLVAADISGLPATLASGSSAVTGGCTNGFVLYNNAGTLGCTAGGGSGTVTSVGMTVPAWLTVAGTPINTAGTLAVTMTTEPQNLFLASPNGSTGGMTPRSITGNDLTSALSSPPAIGNTTANIGLFTTLTASGLVSGAGITSLFASPPSIGNTAAASGAFTTLSATSTVSGAGFISLFASPPSIGTTVANVGAFTQLSATSTVSGAGFSTYLASPPAIGGSAPNTIATTALTISPPSGLTQGINETQTLTGTSTASVGYTANIINVASDNVAANGTPSAVYSTNFLVQDLAFGGAAASGGRINVFSFLTQTAATNSGSLLRDYIGFFSDITSTSGDGGGAGTEKGSYFTYWGVASLGAAATHTSALQAMELDLTAVAGSSVLNKSGLLLGGANADVVHGTSNDNLIWFTNDTSSTGQKYGIQLGRSDISAGIGVGTAGTIMGSAQSATVANIFDFHLLTVTGNAWQSPGSTIDGSGNMVANTYNMPSASSISWGTHSGSNGGSIIIDNGSTNMFFDNLAGGDFIFRTTGAAEVARLKSTGIIKITGASGFAANGSVATAMSSLGPAGSHATVQEWLVVQDSAGTTRWVPAF